MTKTKHFYTVKDDESCFLHYSEELHIMNRTAILKYLTKYRWTDKDAVFGTVRTQTPGNACKESAKNLVKFITSYFLKDYFLLPCASILNPVLAFASTSSL